MGDVTPAELDLLVDVDPLRLRDVALRLMAERDALQERLTLSDEGAQWCEMVAADARSLDAPAGSTEGALREHLLSALALIDHLTREATDG